MADLIDPEVFAFFGCRPFDRAAEELPPGEPCPNCGAVHDAAGTVLTIPTPPDVAEATGIVAIRTGVHAGDDRLVCGRCLCLSPANRSRVAAGTKPRPRRATRSEELASRPRPRLTRSEAAGVLSDAPGRIRCVVRAFLAREAAIESGDTTKAEALAALLATAGDGDPKAFARRLQAINRRASRAAKPVDRTVEPEAAGVAAG